MLTGTRLEVWGDPIAHSRSPQLHLAAYRTLGLDWTFERRRVAAEEFDAQLASLDESFRGLAVTMPGKERAFAAAVRRDRRAELTGAVNTLLLGADGPHGWNTDVGGIVRALDEAGLAGASRLRILGAGATAGSALLAASELGIDAVSLVARRPERAAGLVALGDAVGLPVDVRPFDAIEGTADLTISTLPGGAALPEAQADAAAATGGVLFDVAYSPWPSPLARRWSDRAVAGHGMLLHQAVLQIRIFTTGDVDQPLPDEDAVIAAMRAALAA